MFVTFAHSPPPGYLLWFPPLGYLMYSANIVLNLELLKGCGAKPKIPTYLNVYQSLLSSFSTNVSIAKRTYYHNKINNYFNSCMLFKTFSSFFCPPPPPLSSTLTADDLPRSSLIQIKSSAFKQARITPLLKKPTLNPTLLGNYRPVSLLPFIVKTLERVVFNQVTAFLTQNNLLDRNQSGFRSGHSTETALLSVVEDLRLARTASKSS